MDFKPYLDKIFASVVSVKFFVIVISTVLFCIGKLNQDGWVSMVLTTTGMRVVNEVAAMYAEVRKSESGKKAKA